jgi:hypothetical protein
MSPLHITAAINGQTHYLQGPRTPRCVQRMGYGFTLEQSKAWPFATEKAAANKARIVNAHMGWGDRCKVTPSAPASLEAPLSAP